jgi:hypothetical protein
MPWYAVVAILSPYALVPLLIMSCMKVSSRCSRQEEAAGMYEKSPAPAPTGTERTEIHNHIIQPIEEEHK